MTNDTAREPRVLTGIQLLVTVSCVIVLFAIMFYTVANVINRIVVGTPLPAVIELITRWWMVPLVFGGWLIAHLANEHIRVEFISERTTGIFAPIHQLLNRVLLLVFLGIIAYGGWVSATENRLRNEHGIDTGAPIWITRYAIPLMTAAFIIFVVYETTKLAWRTLRRTGDAGPAQSDSRTEAQHDHA